MIMMLVPRRNSFDLFDDFFRGDDFPHRKEHNLMKTDIKETKKDYIVEMDLPGYSKDNIDISLDNGYLEISAKVEKEENSDENLKYVHKERFYGECSRKFYLGEDIKEEDITAEFDNGILKVVIPKLNEQDKTKDVRRIEIK